MIEPWTKWPRDVAKSTVLSKGNLSTKHPKYIIITIFFVFDSLLIKMHGVNAPTDEWIKFFLNISDSNVDFGS